LTKRFETNIYLCMLYNNILAIYFEYVKHTYTNSMDIVRRWLCLNVSVPRSMSACAIQDDGETEDVFLTDGRIYRYSILQPLIVEIFHTRLVPLSSSVLLGVHY